MLDDSCIQLLVCINENPNRYTVGILYLKQGNRRARKHSHRTPRGMWMPDICRHITQECYNLLEELFFHKKAAEGFTSVNKAK